MAVSVEKVLEHNGLTFLYEVRRSVRAKQFTLSVFRDGRVRVTLPIRADASHVDTLVRSHADWIVKKQGTYKDLPPPRPPLRGHVRDYKKRKEDARVLVHERLKHFNEHYHFSYGRVAIKNMNTRWGSCSGKKNLNFHYKILDLSPEARDYLIIHELCHVKEMNHKPAFWALVAETIPKYRTIRPELKHFVG